MKKCMLLVAAAVAAGGYAQADNILPDQMPPQAQVVRCDNHIVVSQPGAPDLGVGTGSGVRLIEQDGLLFKDLSRTGRLLPYEDWRLSARERAADLASRLSIEQIAGLMLYSSHQAIPATTYDVSPYDGQPYQEGVTDPGAITDHQKKFLREDNLRHILVTTIKDPATAARWNNRVQEYVEGLGWGIPANNSSDPRHSARADAEFNAGGGGKISMWPNPIGLAATFAPEVVKDFGRTASAEYRALGFATALSPQVDLATEPRWYRFYGTFGADPWMGAEMARAYCDGFQTTYLPDGTPAGWGNGSVNAMVKHWPGGGPCESGRDAHYGFGKYAVYPGGCYELHKVPFTQGAFALRDGTGAASAVMPYYTIATGQGDSAVGNSYNYEVITNQLRNQAAYEGVVCTDWAITHDEIHPGRHSGKPWGVEGLSEAERHLCALEAGVDQFGGNNDIRPVLKAYSMGVERHGQQYMDARMRRSAQRLLMNIFRTGLFENPYLDPAASEAIVGNAEFMQRGYDAQLRSVVVLKNHGDVLPVDSGLKAYIPGRSRAAFTNFWGGKVQERFINPVTDAVASRYFTRVDSPEEADVAIVFIDSPMGGWGYDVDEALAGTGNGYHPISLQYRPYTADSARAVSLAGGDPHEASANRTYRGKSTTTVNENELDLILETRRAMGSKPVVAVVNISNAPVVAEFENAVDAILFTFDVQNQAALDIITGRAQPSGRLPFEVPASMEAVEKHCEDMPHDIEPHRDADGNLYIFGHGLRYAIFKQ